MVGVAGFEPAAHWSQTSCATKLRYTPKWQGQKDLNPRHAVLETAALPTELYPYVLLAIFVNCFVTAFSLVVHIQGVLLTPRSNTFLALRKTSCAILLKGGGEDGIRTHAALYEP